MVVSRTIEIENAAKAQLWKIYKFIRKESLQNAEKVRTKILESIKALTLYPEHHPPDKYCFLNDGNFRAYEVYKYRITYYVTDEKIFNLRIQHTKMNPLNY